MFKCLLNDIPAQTPTLFF